MVKRNSIKSRVVVYFVGCSCHMAHVGCSCHMAHNAARKGGDNFSRASAFDVEDLVVDPLLV